MVHEADEEPDATRPGSQGVAGKDGFQCNGEVVIAQPVSDHNPSSLNLESFEARFRHCIVEGDNKLSSNYNDATFFVIFRLAALAQKLGEERGAFQRGNGQFGRGSQS